MIIGSESDHVSVPRLHLQEHKSRLVSATQVSLVMSCKPHLDCVGSSGNAQILPTLTDCSITSTEITHPVAVTAQAEEPCQGFAVGTCQNVQSQHMSKPICMAAEHAGAHLLLAAPATEAGSLASFWQALLQGGKGQGSA